MLENLFMVYKIELVLCLSLISYNHSILYTNLVTLTIFKKKIKNNNIK